MLLVEYEGYEIALPYLCYRSENKAEVWRVRDGNLFHLADVPNVPSLSVNYDAGHVAWFDPLCKKVRQIAPGGIEQEYSIHVDVGECGVLAGHDILFWYNQTYEGRSGVVFGDALGRISEIPGLAFLPPQRFLVVRAGKAIVTDAVLRTGEKGVSGVISDGEVRIWNSRTLSIVSFAPSIPQASIYSNELGTRCRIDIVGTDDSVLGKAIGYGRYITNGSAVVEGNVAVAQFLCGKGEEKTNIVCVFRRDETRASTRPILAIPIAPNREQAQIHIESPYIYTASSELGRWVIHVLRESGEYLYSFFVEKVRSPRDAVVTTVGEMRSASDLCAGTRVSLRKQNDEMSGLFSILPLLCTEERLKAVDNNARGYLPQAIRFWWQ